MACLVVSVIGVIAMDLMAVLSRLPDPGETLPAKSYNESPGGSGNNTAVAAFRITHCIRTEQEGSKEFQSSYDDVDIDVRMVGAVGQDKRGDDLIANLDLNGIPGCDVRRVDHLPTAVFIVIVEARTGESRVITTPGPTSVLTPAEFQIPEQLGNGVVPDLIILELELSRDTVEHIIRLASQSGIDVLLNCAPASQILTSLYRHITHLAFNETECAILSGREVDEVETEESWSEIADEFLALGVKNVLITLGARGAYYANKSERGHVPAEVVKVRDATGAGDTFIGAYGTDYLRQKAQGRWNPREAVIRANRAAAYTVTRLGAQSSMPWVNEVDELETSSMAESLPQLPPDGPVQENDEAGAVNTVPVAQESQTGGA